MYKHLLLYLYLLLPLQLMAQTRAPFTSGNTILITIEGTEGPYEYSSQDMLVRYNENTRKLECVVDINHLYPINEASPIVMARDLFFSARYPEFLIEIDAPVEKINAGNFASQTMDRRFRIFFQDAIKEQVSPVAFTPDQRTIMFSTNFDMMLDSYHIRVPAKYTTMLTGKVMVSIRNARWIDFMAR